MFRGTSPVTLFIAVLLCLGGLGLGPEQLALVVNKNEPESITLAREYALARHVTSPGPAPVSVHDDGYVLWQASRIQLAIDGLLFGR